MSSQTTSHRLTVPDLAAMKGRQKIVALTAYSTPIARLIDPLVDFILVGDSGERDPEIYGAIARKHPKQIQRIFIRSVTDDAPDGDRYKSAFAEVPPERWQVFKKPEDIQR